jgi:hypothetical protein
MESKIPPVLILCALLIVIAGCGAGSAIDLNKVTVTVFTRSRHDSCKRPSDIARYGYR